MISLLPAGDGLGRLSRRDVLLLSGLGGLGLCLPDLYVQAVDSTPARHRATAKNCIYIFLCGRAPRINRTAGRDHWGACYSTVLAGNPRSNQSSYSHFKGSADFGFVLGLLADPPATAFAIVRCSRRFGTGSGSLSSALTPGIPSSLRISSSGGSERSSW